MRWARENKVSWVSQTFKFGLLLHLKMLLSMVTWTSLSGQGRTGVYGTTWSVQKLRKEGTLSFFSGLDKKPRGIVEKYQQQLRKVTCISSNGHLRMIAPGAIWSTHSRLRGETLRCFSWFGLMDSHGVMKNARRQQATVTCTSFSGLGRTEHSGISAPPHLPHTRGILIFCKGFTLQAVHGTKMSAHLQQRNATYTLSNGLEKKVALGHA